ncbi:MAG: tRNA 2-thiouridine(34) synthase MnmA [Chitinophagaceae bacterium]|nr:MAG: tRNA 2-thiouridine(34) synthase MnmA [Chitinophagaceae bacterium]
MSSKGSVLVAMSGGIDSSMVALMLAEEGYKVVGITMKTWDYATSGGSKKETGCCSLDSINDARQVAVDHKFPHYIIDIRNEFGDYVIDNFVDEYLAGRTPNPCVLCNTHIKWEALLRHADNLGCQYIATGHYAQLQYNDGRYYVSKGKDENKDQSYVLWGLSQDCLARTMLPLGGMNKQDIRQLALDRGYEELAKKSESYEICFVPDNDYRGFLKRNVEDLEARVDGGDFINNQGEVIGKHKGYPFYTIGQRKGLGIALGKPIFVTEIIPETNTVVIGEEDELRKNTMTIGKVNYLKYDSIPDGMELITKIRYKDAGAYSKVYNTEDGKLSVQFAKDVKAIAPGQSAVFYEGNDVVGGGIIFSGRKMPWENL